MLDLKVLDTRGVIELLDAGIIILPDEIFVRLDAQGKHILQAHGLYNQDPYDSVIHARSMFKTYDEYDVDDWPITTINIPRRRWDDLPDFYPAVG